MWCAWNWGKTDSNRGLPALRVTVRQIHKYLYEVNFQELSSFSAGGVSWRQCDCFYLNLVYIGLVEIKHMTFVKYLKVQNLPFCKQVLTVFNSESCTVKVMLKQQYLAVQQWLWMLIENTWSLDNCFWQFVRKCLQFEGWG